MYFCSQNKQNTIINGDLVKVNQKDFIAISERV